MARQNLNESATKGDLKKEFKKYDTMFQKQLDEDFGQVFKRLGRVENQQQEISQLLKYVATTVDNIHSYLHAQTEINQQLKLQITGHEKRITKLENS